MKQPGNSLTVPSCSEANSPSVHSNIPKSRMVLTRCYLSKPRSSAKFKKCLILLAHPTRFERVTFAFGGQRSFFEPNMGRSFRKLAVLIAQTLASGSPPAGFLALSPPNLRWRLFYPRRGQSGTLLCAGLVRRVGTSAVLHELVWYCNAVPEKVRRHRGTEGDRLKNLKRKENAPIVSFEPQSTQKSGFLMRRQSYLTSICYRIDFALHP